jgi:hypothetical protein
MCIELPPIQSSGVRWYAVAKESEWCSTEHMPDDALLRRQLQESQQSRVRAWKALQGLRQVLARVADHELAPSIKPLCFRREGETLRRALVDVLLRLHRDIDDLEKAIERVRPFIGTSTVDPSLPTVMVQLNRAMQKPRVAASELARMR